MDVEAVVIQKNRKKIIEIKNLSHSYGTKKIYENLT